MAANKESLFKIGQNVLSNTVNTGRNLLNKVDFANIVPDPTPEQIEADYISKLGNFAQSGISKGQETLQGLQDFAQQSVQPAQTNVMEQGDLYGPIDQKPQQQGFLRPLIDYAKSPEGTQMLADLARLGVAATRKDPIVAGTMAQGLSQDLAQRPIQAAKREKAAQDKEMFDLKLDKLVSETDLNRATTQDFISKQGQIPEDYTVVTKEDYENVPYSYKKYYKKFKKSDGTYNYGASIQGLEKIEKRLPSDRQSVRVARDASEMVSKNVDSLLNSPSFNRMVGMMKVGAFNIPKGETKTKLKLADQDDIAFMETLKTIAADKFLTTLKNTRSEKTGATGFGQLNATEFKTLERSITSLKETQSPEVFRENLLTIKGILERGARRAERDFVSIHRDLPQYDTIPITNYEDMPTGGIEVEATTDTRTTSQKLIDKGVDYLKGFYNVK
jgi:hypothetical protein